jgi:hypothetical protein
VTRQADGAAIVPWGYPALLLATLFLNFAFWYGVGRDFPFHGPGVWYLVQVLGGAVLLGALFFLGPALAGQSAKRSLFELAERSLGSTGAIGLRVCCAAFLVVWLAGLVWMIVRWLLGNVSAAVERLAAGSLALLLFWIGMQSLRAAVRLGFLTNVLGIVLLIAALMRGRAGWPEAIQAMTRQGWMVETPDLWRGLAQLSFWAAPLLFLASDFGQRCPGRRQVCLIGVFGIVLPAAGTLLTAGFIERAAGHGARYSLAIVAVTMFGVVGFGARLLGNCLAVLRGHRFAYWTLLGLAVGAIAALASILFLDVSSVLYPLARGLVAAAAVISADFLTGRWRATVAKKIDWIGVTAFLIGWGLPYVLDLIIDDLDTPAQDPLLVQAYILSFSICLLCRVARIGYDRIGDLCATLTRTTLPPR